MSGFPIALRGFGAAEEAAVADRLARTGRAQIADLLAEPAATRLLDEARRATPFQTVTTTASRGHVDMPAAWLESLTPAARTEMAKAVQETATQRFQYLYDSHPIWDMAQGGRLEGGPWRALIDFLNGEDFLAFARRITGEDRIAYCDAQVTRYRRGHFLTAHDDDVEGKQRYFAYVLNLTPHWRVEWGGLLMFHGDDGHVAEAFKPNFNALNLLKVPTPHSVSQVSLFAGDDRISVTGWLRGR